MEYKRAIRELVDKIETEKVLKRIYRFVQYLWTTQK